MNPIVKQNIAMMVGEGPGHLAHLLAGERMRVREDAPFLYGGANFHYDSQGLIACFGNILQLPSKIRASCKDATFGVEYDSTKNPFSQIHSMSPKEKKQLIKDGSSAKDILKAYRIVELINVPEGEAKRNLEDTMGAFNEAYGFL